MTPRRFASILLLVSSVLNGSAGWVIAAGGPPASFNSADDEIPGAIPEPPPAAEAPPSAETPAPPPAQAAQPEAQPEAAAPAAPEPAPAPEPPKRKKRKRGWETNEDDIVRPWPGRFIGVRTSLGLGNSVVPRLGVHLASNLRATISEASPYLGLETGYTKGSWGASISFDGTPIIGTPEFLASPPWHLIMSITVSYIQNQTWRYIFGLDPLVYYHMSYASGQVMLLQGVGWRVGVHRFITRLSDSFTLDGFAILSGDYFRSATAGVAGNDHTYSVADFVGEGVNTSAIVLLLGLQLGWNL
jgi:hypothetical protein